MSATESGAGERVAIPNAGPWEHLDGSPCPYYVASRPRPNADDYWWCTEHQQHVRPATPDADDASDLMCTGAGLVPRCTCPPDEFLSPSDCELHPECYCPPANVGDGIKPQSDCAIHGNAPAASTDASGALSDDEAASDLTLTILRHYGYTDDDIAEAEAVHPGRVCDEDTCWDEDGENIHPSAYNDLYLTATLVVDVVLPWIERRDAARESAAATRARAEGKVEGLRQMAADSVWDYTFDVSRLAVRDWLNEQADRIERGAR